jgi:PAS domain S-box-containing protein
VSADDRTCQELEQAIACLSSKVSTLEVEAQRLRTTLQSIGDAVISVDTRGSILQMNPTAEALTGWRQAEATGQPLADIFRIVNEDSGAVVESPIVRVLRKGVVVGLANHTLLIAKDGTKRPIADSGAPIRNEQGEITGVVLVFRDQSEEREAQKALKASEERFRMMVENVKDYALIMLDVDGFVTGWNTGAERIKGYRVDQIVGQRFSSFYPREDVERGKPEQELATAAADGRFEDEAWRVRKDGSQFWANVIITPLRDNAGKLYGFGEISRDITERKRTEEALRESERKFRDAVRYLDEGYYVCAVDGLLQEHNVAFNRILGFDGDRDLRGSKLPDFWQNPQDRSDYLSELMSTGVVRNFLINAKTVAGNQLVVLANSHLVKDADGNPVRIEGIVADFTELKRAEERIKHLNLALKAVRNVNQLIVREKDASVLIRRCCEILTETRGYFTAWVALYDESRRYLAAASAGFGDAFEPLQNRLASHQLGACGIALSQRGVHVVHNPAAQCPDCPAATFCKDQSAIAVRLEHESHTRGLLVTALKLALERCPDVPFIMLTGSMNEDTAVECMKAGAWDYVIKEHVKRLEQAVQSALQRQYVTRSLDQAAIA